MTLSPASLIEILARLRSANRDEGAPDYERRMAALAALDRVVLAARDDIVRAVAEDCGGHSGHESLLAEVFATLDAIRHTRKHLRTWMQPEPRSIPLALRPSHAEVICQALGVVGIIAPRNFPVHLALAPLVGVIAAGNRAIIKPSEMAPASSALLARVVAETFAADHVTVVCGGPEVGEALARLPLDHLVFTGSTRVGRAVLRAASDNLVPVTLELGGKSPAIVGADFPVEVAALRIMAAKLFNAGQTCVAPDYALVPEGGERAFVAACRAHVARLYPRLLENPDYSPVPSAPHRARLESYLADARARGAEVVEINPAGERFPPTACKVPPALVVGASDDMAVMQEEIFGPILPIRSYRTLDQAIGYVNERPRPLALYYFGHRTEDVRRVRDETLSGGVTINHAVGHAAQHDLPFGGVGASGMGHYHGRDGFETFSKKKPVFYQSRLDPSALVRPPYGPGVDTVLKLMLR